MAEEGAKPGRGGQLCRYIIKAGLTDRPKRTAKMAKLWVCDEEHSKDPFPAIAAIWRIDGKQQRQADDLDSLASEIGKYDKLEELVLCYHGYSGGILVGGDAYTLSDPQIAKAFAKKKTQIDCIRFEGCWVGEDPDEMAAFGRLFGSSTVSGFTWTGWSNTIDLNMPKGTTPEALKKLVEPFEKWFVPNSVNMPMLAQRARQGSRQTIGLLWYQYTLDDHPPYLNDNYRKFGAVTFKARNEARPRTVAAKDAKPSDSPHPPFEYVTVKL